MDDFIKKVENEAWSEEKVNEACGFTSEIVEESGEEIITKKVKEKPVYKILMIIFASIIGVLMAIIIFLLLKLSQKDKAIHPKDEITNSNNNINVDSIKNL